jgi:hypothetical protein
MKINEVLAGYQGQRTDEFVQALAPIAGAIGRGAVAGAQMLGKGAAAAANAVGNTVSKVAQAGTQAGTQAAQAVAPEVQQLAQTTSNVKSGVDSVKNALQQAGGGPAIDSNKLSQTLATQAPGQKLDPTATKELQKMLPGLGAAMSNPSSANAIKQAINTGMQAQQKQNQTQQQQPTSAGSVGSTSNTVGSA